ncbi:Histidine kinase [Hyella patelloides LEGE 07179]|uniref:Circadian input-output histidine kinase CikA n=1 Tax=Hyella patelloides LEGE 07179 TaxID=945734 RepID=A0A563VWA3_9CYAN|nr:hybrid sensor histidine kinase/response regulator [Hyella patelloides]VEP15533.1 Histidine kinase [Hyella patelloides LEGE 07179]
MNLDREKELSVTNSSPLSKATKGVPLPLVLVVPFVLQIFAAVGITSYLSFRNGQKAVNELATQLTGKTSDLVAQHLDIYLSTPRQINQLNLDGLETGLLDIENFQQTKIYLWKQIKLFKDVGYISLGTANGNFMGAGRYQDGNFEISETSRNTNGKNNWYFADEQGKPLEGAELSGFDEYDFKSEAWYSNAVQAGKPIWSDIYQWEDYPEYISIALSYPIYDAKKQLLGVLSVDQQLSQVSSFLRDIEVSPSGKVFILERNGLLVGSSSNEQPYKLIKNEAKRLKASESSDQLIKATTNYLKEKFNSLKNINQVQQLKFEIEGSPQFVQVTPWKDELGLDWLVVVAMPESDFMAEIHANNRTTILLCIASLVVATLLGIITSGWITRPIRRLSDASNAIANGDLDRTVEVFGVNELGVLAHSFNQMASQLKASFTQLDVTNKTLESTNAELDRTNQELEQTNQELENRVTERTQELQISKEKAEQAQQTAEVANKAKSTFLANMSHELRTPLNAILGFTQIMQRDQTATRAQKENLAIVNRSGEHLLALINDVLDISKIEAGRISLNPSSFDLHRLLDTTAEMLEFKADAKGLQLLFERHLDTPQYICTDEQKLRQVLINLLNNAIKFTTEGSVTLRVKPDTTDINTLLFEIEDTGAGIAPEELGTLFEAFTQTESGRQSEEGTGLGLPISRKFVQLMGGELTASSQLGVGTVFKFNIIAEAALEEELQPQKPPKKVIGLEPNQPNYRILVVDDRWENRQIVLKLLEPIGFETKEAVNGKEAIAIWEQWQPHLIWMDMRMPVMNGYEATEYIKSHLKGQATYIIALTASTFEEERAIILSTGCDDFVRKPFRGAVLFDKMAEYLGVRYVYAKNNESAGIVAEPISDFILEPTSLRVMPSEWLTQLGRASADLNEKMVAELIAQIPVRHTLLTQALQNKVKDFDFDDIVDLVEQTVRETPP